MFEFLIFFLLGGKDEDKRIEKETDEFVNSLSEDELNDNEKIEIKTWLQLSLFMIVFIGLLYAGYYLMGELF